LSAGTRLRLSLGGFRLAPGNLRRDGGLARLFLLPRLALGGRFALWLIGMGVRQMHRQVQDLEATMRASDRRGRALDRSFSVARDIGAPPDTRRTRHDHPKLRRVDNASPSAVQAIWIGAPTAAGALGWMIRFHNHQPLPVATPSVHRHRLDVFRVVRRQGADDREQLMAMRGRHPQCKSGPAATREYYIMSIPCRLFGDEAFVAFVRTTSPLRGASRESGL